MRVYFKHVLSVLIYRFKKIVLQPRSILPHPHPFPNVLSPTMAARLLSFNAPARISLALAVPLFTCAGPTPPSSLLIISPLWGPLHTFHHHFLQPHLRGAHSTLFIITFYSLAADRCNSTFLPNLFLLFF